MNGEEGKSQVTDVRNFWQLDPAVRESLPTEWIKKSYDKWKSKNHAGKDVQDVKAGWAIETEKKMAEAEAEAVDKEHA